MSYRSKFFAAVLCAMAASATCLGQSSSFSVTSSSDNLNATSGWTPKNIYAIDMNNDGIPDLVQDYASAGSLTGGLNEFGVSLANGDGTFRPAIITKMPPFVPVTPLTFGDFNGDGKIDIALTLSGRTTLAIYLGYGDGTFASPWYFNMPFAPGETFAGGPLVAADFNHDGKMDLAVVAATAVGTTLYILPGAGTGVFSTVLPIFTAPNGNTLNSTGIQNMFIGDYDSDNNADIALTMTLGAPTGGTATSTIFVLYGAGNFSFLKTSPYSQPGSIYLGSGDLNSDGFTDLYALDAANCRLETFYAQPGRTFAAYTAPVPAAAYNVDAYLMSALAMADFNDDGRMDLVTTVAQNGQVYLAFFLAASAPGQFTTQTWNIVTYPLVSYQTAPVVGDFNRDSKPDFAFVQYFSPGGASIYAGLNTSTLGLFSNCDYPAANRGVHVCSPSVSSAATVNFNATAHSFGDLRKMELWVDGKKLAEQRHTWGTNAWFNFSSSLAAGSHQATVFSANVDGTLLQNTFNFAVPSACSAPASAGVHICAPAGSAHSASPVTVQAASTVNGTLSRMEVWVDSAKRYTQFGSASLSSSFNMTAGAHTITVYAVNTIGTVWSQAVSITVP